MKVLYYPMGAGGHWLKSTITQVPLEDKHYSHFHELDIEESWIRLQHLDTFSDNGLIFSGSYYFNFFVNHMYKCYHSQQNLFDNYDHETHWKLMISVSFGICQSVKNKKYIDFNFDNLIIDPNNFYNTIVDLQKTDNKPIISYDDFLHRRKKFIDSCVNIDNLIENFDNKFWIAFVLGQLMLHDISPIFSITDPDNQDLCKKFAKDHYKQCQLKNFSMIDTKVFLPTI
jgi:hypothetical protein